MCKIKASGLKASDVDNKRATVVIALVTIILVSVYIVGLFILVNSKTSYTYDMIWFIKIFELILSGVAIGSCILCYNSTNKEELFIISLMYVVFFIDIALGNVDAMSLTDSIIDENGYIIVATSLIRIIILMISVFPFTKIKKIIINNKLKSYIVVIIGSIIIGALKYNNIIFPRLESSKQFINYNILLLVVYIVVASKFFIKSINQKEYIYSVIGSSILFFAIKAIYAIAGAINPLANIKIASISITYMGFIIFIAGLLLELSLSIKRNKELESEIKIFYKLVDESKHNCIILYDQFERIRYVNKSTKEYLYKDKSITFSEIEEKVDFYLEEVGETFIKEIRSEVKEKGSWKGNIKFNSRDITLNCFIQNIHTYDNKENMAVIFKDISHRIRAKNSLMEYEKMKNHEKIKNEFFANISHELKTPLNIFYSTVQLLDVKSEEPSTNFNETYIYHRQSLKINCQRMLRLINNIVDITKIDVGFTKPEFINCDIVRLVEDITLSVINYANPKDINIIFDTEVEEVKIKCDPDMIERVMLNLLSNAIKFSKENGQILVSMYSDEKWIYIRVKDDGIGIPIQMQGVIFDRFVQGDKSLTRLNEGSGIGLSIVKSIVELNEGEIYLESDGENGTEFEILLPNKISSKVKEIDESEYAIDIQKIELELSDIYKLYE